MKRKFTFLFVTLAAFGVVACEDSSEFRRNENFDVPALTDNNSIVLTLYAHSGFEIDRLSLHGGKIAVDWGDGSPITKDIHPEKAANDVGYSRLTEFSHTYTTAGHYTVRIWSEELTLIGLSGYVPGGEAKKFDDISFGDCPELEIISLSDIAEVETLNLNRCTALRRLSVNDCDHLRSIILENCPLEKYISIGNNPMLSSLDLASKTLLDEISCHDNALEELFLPAGITYIGCSGNRLRTLDLSGIPNLEKLFCDDNPELSNLILDGCDKLQSLGLSNTAIEEFDFGAFPLLTTILCGNSKLRSVDVSGNTSLYHLECQRLSLTALDIGNNSALRYLDISDNTMREFSVSNQQFMFLNISNNEFMEDALNDLFTALPDAVYTRALPPPQPSTIAIKGNPGVARCNTKIITDKGWYIANM